MIISASRRTDIPAYYTEWFMNRIREKSIRIRNPFRPAHVESLSLDPENVEAIVFWTRNAEPLTPYLNILDSMGYRYYFQYTLVEYPEAFENPFLSMQQKIDRFRRLSDRIGPERTIWRYDPIIMSNLTDALFHRERFEAIAYQVRGFTHQCMVSFLDIYRKTRRALDKLEKEKGIRVFDIHRDETKVRQISKFLGRIGQESGVEVTTCAEPFDLEDLGIRHGRCIDDERIRSLFGTNLSLSKDKSQRKFCRCVESKDIGAYDTCPRGCVYCYANSSPEVARRNIAKHDRSAPLLL